MSKMIAPGDWDEAGRRAAKVASTMVGIVLILWGMRQLQTLLDAVSEAAVNGSAIDIGMWHAVITLLPLLVGCIATFPNVVLPLAYRVIDRFMKDADDSEES